MNFYVRSRQWEREVVVWKKKKVIKKTILVAGITLWILVSPLLHAEGNGVNPYVYARVANDDNLFRLSDDAEALAVIGTVDPDDTVTQIGAGLDIDAPFSRQRLRANLSVYKADYSRFDSLDHVGADVSSVVNWEVGNLFAGDVGFKFTRQLSRFYELQAIAKDIRTRKIFFLNGGYRFHPSWRVVGDFSILDLTQTERPQLDRSESSQAVELQLSTSANTKLGTRIRHTKGNFERLQIVNGNEINNDFTEMEYSVVLYWEGSKKSRLEGRLGLTQRDHAQASERNFNGTTGRLSYAWLITAKTRIDSAIWRETTTREELTIFVVGNGVSIEPKWFATRKISVAANIERETRDFEGISEAVALVDGTRQDTATSLGVSVKYEPLDNVALSLGYDNERRNSNIDRADFRSTLLFVRAQVSF